MTIKCEGIDLLTTQEAAKLLNVSAKSINYNLNNNNIVSVNFDGVRRICRVDLLDQELTIVDQEVVSAEQLAKLLKVSYHFIITKEFFKEFLVSKNMRLKRYSLSKIIKYINDSREKTMKINMKDVSITDIEKEAIKIRANKRKIKLAKAMREAS